MATSEYPQHEKLSEVVDDSQAIGAFLETIQNQGVHLMVWREGNGEPQFIKRREFEDEGEKVRSGMFSGEDFIENPDYVPKGWVAWKRGGIQVILAEYFGIDYDELMREKERMLEGIRAAS